MLFRDTSLSKGDGFLAMFAINSLSSWYSLKQLRAKIVREHDDDETIPMVIIANKTVSECVIIFSGEIYVCVGKWLHNYLAHSQTSLVPKLPLFLFVCFLWFRFHSSAQKQKTCSSSPCSIV